MARRRARGRGSLGEGRGVAPRFVEAHGVADQGRQLVGRRRTLAEVIDAVFGDEVLEQLRVGAGRRDDVQGRRTARDACLRRQRLVELVAGDQPARLLARVALAEADDGDLPARPAAERPAGRLGIGGRADHDLEVARDRRPLRQPRQPRAQSVGVQALEPDQQHGQRLGRHGEAVESGDGVGHGGFRRKCRNGGTDQEPAPNARGSLGWSLERARGGLFVRPC